jgi:MYXO-CTERM domain-containing protein
VGEHKREVQLSKHSKALVLTSALFFASATPAMAQDTVTTDPAVTTTDVRDDDDDNGEWGWLGLLGLAGLLGLKRRDDHRHTNTTGTSTSNRL